MQKFIPCIFLIFIAGAANGIMDDLQFHYADTVFAKFENQRFWNPEISWTNKYAHDKEGVIIKPLKPAFIGSTTFLVSLTDAWHLFKLIYNGSLRLCIVLLFWFAYEQRLGKWYEIILLWSGLAILQSLFFHLTYTLL